MPETLPSNLSVQDIKTIIHGLKMAGFSFVDPQALSEINAMIKSLPGPEEIDGLTENGMESIKKIAIDVGRIMRLIEIYGQRDQEYKSRYKARTGLPPRYKVMEWRKAMKQETKQLVKELVQASSIADSKGKFIVAEKLVKCAKKVQSETAQEQDLIDVIDDMERLGFAEEAKQIREAGIWSGLQGLGDWATQGVKDVAQKGKEAFQVGRYQGDIAAIVQKIGKLIADVGGAASSANPGSRKTTLEGFLKSLQAMQTASQQAQGAMQQASQAEAQQPAGMQSGAPAGSVQIGGKTVQVQYDNATGDAFVVNPQDGKQYTVKEDGTGKRTLHPRGAPAAAAAPAAGAGAPAVPSAVNPAEKTPAAPTGGEDITKVDRNELANRFRAIQNELSRRKKDEAAKASPAAAPATA